MYYAPTKTDLPYNFCFIIFLPSVTVEAVDSLQTLVKLGPHAKFGEDWSNGVDFYSGHTHTDSTLYIRFSKM